jgi:hypothetical protein
MVKRNYALEELMKRGVMDERDIDYLDHLKVPEVEVNDVAVEGIFRAVVHDGATVYTDAYREMKGWFLGMESKRKYIEEICIDLIDWLKDKELEEKGLDLDMGTFKTWMKTSETFFWRYYFLLDDGTWKRIETDLRTDRISGLEQMYDINFKDRTEIARYLDSVKDIKGLIEVVETYKDRSNKFFTLISKRRTTVKSFPFQVILLGAADLRRTVKKIVNLAI